MKTNVNGVHFTRAEMEIIWKALDLKASNCDTVEIMFEQIAKQDRPSQPPKEAKKSAKYARLEGERARSAQEKWHRVCLGYADDGTHR